MKIKANTVGYVDSKKYDRSTGTQHIGLIAIIIGIITAIVGTVSKANSYKLYVDDKTHEINVNERQH